MANPLMSLRQSGVDRPLLWAVALLSLAGLVIVTSASLQIGETRLGNPFYYGMRHGLYLLAGVGVGLFVYCCVPLAVLEKLRFAALPVAVVFLLLVFVPGLGREVNGSTRWIALPGLTIQASEVVKLCFVLYLAGYILAENGTLPD